MERFYKCGKCKKVYHLEGNPTKCENCGGELLTYQEYYDETPFEGFVEPLDQEIKEEEEEYD